VARAMGPFASHTRLHSLEVAKACIRCRSGVRRPRWLVRFSFSAAAFSASSASSEKIRGRPSSACSFFLLLNEGDLGALFFLRGAELPSLLREVAAVAGLVTWPVALVVGDLAPGATPRGLRAASSFSAF